MPFRRTLLALGFFGATVSVLPAATPVAGNAPMAWAGVLYAQSFGYQPAQAGKFDLPIDDVRFE